MHFPNKCKFSLLKNHEVAAISRSKHYVTHKEATKLYLSFSTAEAITSSTPKPSIKKLKSKLYQTSLICKGNTFTQKDAIAKETT